MAEAAPKVHPAAGSNDATRSSNAANKRVLRALVIGEEVEGARTVPVKKLATEGTEPGKSQQLGEDPFATLSSAGEIVEPPFDLLTLSMLTEHNSELGPCIDAYMTNIDAFGHRQVARVTDVAKMGDELKKNVEHERVRLENFFAYASLRESFTETRKRLRRDIESTGNGYLEIVRGPKGDIQTINHLPSYLMRLGKQEAKLVEVDVPILELQDDGSVKATTVKSFERFRVFVQSRAVHNRGTAVSSSNEVAWFKEFGDPRVYDCRTGKVESPDKPVPKEHHATEVVHFKLYAARSPYGLPRFIGNLLSIFGERAAEEINYLTFKNNNIPSMALLVSNGQLTDGTIARIQNFVESQIQGSSNYSKFLIIEAEAAGSDEGEDVGTMKLAMEPLTKVQHTDALFTNYTKEARGKLRGSFRLPGLFLGGGEAVNRSTAEVSRKITDEQVFAPERDEFDNFINRRLYPAMGIIYHKFRSNSPNTTDNKELISIISDAEKTGGMTPRIARLVLHEILGIDLPEFPQGFPVDVPFSLLMAEAVKNQADPAEPGQQVTALKDAPSREKFIADPGGFVRELMGMRTALESKWSKLKAKEPPHDSEDGVD